MGHRRPEAERRRLNETERRAADAERVPERDPPAEHILTLQSTAGNRAVSALLARSPETAVPTDDKGTEASGPRASLPGIGTISLLAVSLDSNRGGGGPGGGRGKAEPPTEIVLTSVPGTHSPLLSKAALDGKPMDVQIVMPHGSSATRVSLKNAIVHSYSTSGADDRAIESWALNCSAITYSIEGEAGKSDAKGPGGGLDDAAGPGTHG